MWYRCWWGFTGWWLLCQVCSSLIMQIKGEKVTNSSIFSRYFVFHFLDMKCRSWSYTSLPWWLMYSHTVCIHYIHCTRELMLIRRKIRPTGIAFHSELRTHFSMTFTNISWTNLASSVLKEAICGDSDESLNFPCTILQCMSLISFTSKDPLLMDLTGLSLNGSPCEINLLNLPPEKPIRVVINNFHWSLHHSQDKRGRNTN